MNARQGPSNIIPGRRRLFWSGLLLTLLPVGAAQAGTWTVKTDNTGDFLTVTAAIGSTQVVAGDTVLVYPGTYRENIAFLGKAITVKSVEGPEQTILDGSLVGALSTVTFNAGETSSSVLSGFTIKKGKGTRINSSNYGGGIYVTNASPKLEDLIIRENAATFGGGIACNLNANPTLHNVRIEANSATNAGGGVYVNNGDPVLTQVKILGNSTTGSGSDGAGMWASKNDGLLENVLIADNIAVRNGGGLYTDGGGLTLRFVTVAANEAAVSGGGIYVGSTAPFAILNSVIVASNAGYGVDFKNTAVGLTYSDIFGNSPLDYAVTSAKPVGLGNLSLDPTFVALSLDTDPSNDDYHLQEGSGAIDRGDPAYLDPDTSRADMGVFGGPNADVTASDRDNDGMPDAWEIANGTDPDMDDSAYDADVDGLSNLEEYGLGTNPQDPDTDADGVSDGDEVDLNFDPLDPSDNMPTARIKPVSGARAGVEVTLDGTDSSDPTNDPLLYRWSMIKVPTGSSVNSDSIGNRDVVLTSFTPDLAGDYTVELVVADAVAQNTTTAVIRVGAVGGSGYDVPVDFPNIQSAIDAAPDDTVISVGPGTYNESIDFLGKALVVQSLDGPEATIIKAVTGKPVVSFINGEVDTSKLKGFTLTGGSGARFSTQSYGGGIYIEFGSPWIEGNIITTNSATFGGGIAVYGGDIGPTITGNRIEKNTSSGDGGGIYFVSDASGIVTNNWINDNKVSLTTGRGGAVYMVESYPALYNNLMVGNVAGSTGSGGGVMVDLGANPVMVNNTLAYNSSGSSNGAGALQVDNASGRFVNNLLVFSAQGYGFYPRYATNVVFQYNDVFGNQTGAYYTGPNGGTDLTGRDGNIEVDPQFKTYSADGNASNDSFLLKTGSGAIDQGDPSILDSDGTRSDMGAYGGPGADLSGLFPDQDQDGLPDWWETTYGTGLTVPDASDDPDGDGLTNAQEYGLGTNPQSADTDQDGVNDDVEVSQGGNPVDPSNHQPVAVISPDLEVLPGEKAWLNGAASSDPDGAALTYAWTLVSAPAGSSVVQETLEGADTVRVGFTADKAGAYVLKLVVNDGTVSSSPAQGQVKAVQILRVPTLFETIQEAIDAASDGARIEVDPGTYEELIDFKGKAIHVMAVDPSKATTIAAPRTGGSVVTFKSAEKADAVLEGFTLSGGTGSIKGGTTRYGGAVFIQNASPTLLELTVTSNKAAYGAGIACVDGGSPIIRRSTITNNTADLAGGGVYSTGCLLTLQTSSLITNIVTGSSMGGGGLAEVIGNGLIENVLFAGNESGGNGGAIMIDGAAPTIVNNTLVGNTALISAGLYAKSSSAKVFNNIIVYQDTGAGLVNDDEVLSLDVQYNLFYANQGGSFGGYQPDVVGSAGNLEADPLFVKFSNDSRFTNDDFHLQAGSPAIDAGDPSRLDVDGTRSDLGAYGGPGMNYTDVDGDGFAVDEGDCNNTDPSIYPGATDIGDGKDNNCDGLIDEDVIECRDGTLVWVTRSSPAAPTPRPSDPTPTPTPDPCGPADTATPVVDPNDQDGDGYTVRKGDCDDTNPDVNPGEDEVLGNDIDDDCDGCVDKLECPTPTPKPTPTPEPTPVPTDVPTPTEAPEPSGSPTPGSDDPGSCACTVPGERHGNPVAGGALLLVAAGFMRRRKR